MINASAIGYYGPTGDEELTESSPAGSDFLAQLCVDWERATAPAAAQGIRTVNVRVGVVLDPGGGALQKMITPFKMFVGGPIGSGKQYVSWIHHEDLVGLILLALDNPEASGPLNATAPGAVTNKEFSKALGRALHRPSFMPTPGFMLRVALGQVAGRHHQRATRGAEEGTGPGLSIQVRGYRCGADVTSSSQVVDLIRLNRPRRHDLSTRTLNECSEAHATHSTPASPSRISPMTYVGTRSSCKRRWMLSA